MVKLIYFIVLTQFFQFNQLKILIKILVTVSEHLKVYVCVWGRESESYRHANKWCFQHVHTLMVNSLVLFTSEILF